MTHKWHLDASTHTVAQTRIVSGSDGKVLWAHSDETANGTTTQVPLEDLKAHALSAAGSSIASKAGFTAVPVVLAPVTIALVALRRRP